MRATKEVILPLTGGLLAMILAPPSLTWAVHKLLNLPIYDGRLCKFLPQYS